MGGVGDAGLGPGTGAAPLVPAAGGRAGARDAARPAPGGDRGAPRRQAPRRPGRHRGDGGGGGGQRAAGGARRRQRRARGLARRRPPAPVGSARAAPRWRGRSAGSRTAHRRAGLLVPGRRRGLRLPAVGGPRRPLLRGVGPRRSAGLVPAIPAPALVRLLAGREPLGARRPPAGRDRRRRRGRARPVARRREEARVPRRAARARAHDGAGAHLLRPGRSDLAHAVGARARAPRPAPRLAARGVAPARVPPSRLAGRD